MDLAGFQYDPVSLDVNKVWFGEELHIPNMRENQEKVKSLLNGADVGNVEYNGHRFRVFELWESWSCGIFSVIRYDIEWQKCSYWKS